MTVPSATLKNKGSPVKFLNFFPLSGQRQSLVWHLRDPASAWLKHLRKPTASALMTFLATGGAQNGQWGTEQQGGMRQHKNAGTIGGTMTCEDL